MSLHQDENDLVLRSRCKYVHLKSHSAAQITRQNLVIILQQLLYHSKISFIALSEEYVALGRFLSDLLHKTYFYYINFEYCRHTPNFVLHSFSVSFVTICYFFMPSALADA